MRCPHQCDSAVDLGSKINGLWCKVEAQIHGFTRTLLAVKPAW